MKDLFVYLRQLLKTLPSIAWIDLDKGQLNNYEVRPSIDFPAVLLKLEYPSTTKLSGKQQQCNVILTASIVFDFMDDTSSITPDDILEQSLKVFDIADEVHKKLQGAMDVTVIRTPLDRASVRDPNRADKIKVLQYVYTTKTIE
ncbi:hypothetical protein KO02_17525 [Sphingobacterium sp. ML3W]|uniref:hypothetical protein n=1 Tax=Sphingobacterium sp. ML3W TaxID=1538644 RepID=UPI0004F92F5D|nr:hypothetical protein [Sphingobacterium sp. ML3W]AIM38283.1 hypothetical protein KO02_17525 [Sphingobacterium sp. ML3W]